MKNGYQKYKTTAIQSASKEQLLLMLYEGAIKFTKRAMLAIDNKDIAERGLNIGKAYDIIMELTNTLNHEVGGDLSTRLEQLYMFITDQLTLANAKGVKKPLEDALRILETLYDGWSKAIDSLNKKA